MDFMIKDTTYESLDVVKEEIKQGEGASAEQMASLYFLQADSVRAEASSLVAEINAAISQLERVRGQVTKNPLSATPNSLGILQSHTSLVESAVGRFTAAKSALQRIENALGQSHRVWS